MYFWLPTAQNGHLEICKLILENVQEKNPKNNNGLTPLDLASNNGNSEICKLLRESIEKPKDGFGKIPRND